MKRIKEEMSKKLNESFGSTSLFKKQSNQVPLHHLLTEPPNSPK